jgi:glycerophosphoryl diester phosphodiesterase
MHLSTTASVLAGLAMVGSVAAVPCPGVKPIKNIQLGPRPYYLIDDLDEGPLKKKLASCKEMKMKASSWSFGHRGGGTLMIPEHSKEGNLAGARMGAGTLECDVTFTKDRQLVCRHSQCDLHGTTNVVAIPELNAKCTQPFVPANGSTPASAKCCTSDFTLAEFKTLCAKMESLDPTATTPQQFLGGTPHWRTDLYNSCGTLLSHKEHIAMVDQLGLDHTPELKAPEVKMPYEGDYTQEDYAQQMIDDYKDMGVDPSRVWAQSFVYSDVLYWLAAEPEFGRQAMYLDETGDTPDTFPLAINNLTRYANDGIKIVAPPLNYLVAADADGQIVPSRYANRANELGLQIISWSLERSPPIEQIGKAGDYYYTPILNVLKRDGDIFRLIDVLAQQVGIIGLFSDWSATATYYANCFAIDLL